MQQDTENINSSDKSEMSFLGHLEALRWHLIRSVLAIAGFAIAAFVNKSFVFDTILLAPKNPNFPTYKLMCAISESICIHEIPFKLMNISMSGQFSTHIFVSAIAGFVAAFPYVFWEIWRFVKPGLHAKETKHAKGVVFFTSLLFISGILFGYFIVTPLAVNFLGSYQVSKEVMNQINLESYINIVAGITLACGVVFELPILTYFLTKVGIINPSFMRKYRKHSFVVALILAAIITPTPDVLSQILVAIPLIVLYEVSILVSSRVERKERKFENEAI